MPETLTPEEIRARIEALTVAITAVTAGGFTEDKRSTVDTLEQMRREYEAQHGQ